MRTILHSDLNNFYASVACLQNPSLRKVPMAVTRASGTALCCPKTNWPRRRA